MPTSSRDAKVILEARSGRGRVEALLNSFGALIPVSVIVVLYAAVAWPLLTAHRRRRRPPREAAITAALDVSVAATAFLVLCLVFMPMGGSHTSTLHLMPGEDLASAAGDSDEYWQVGGNAVLLGPLGALVPLRVPRLRSVLRSTLAAMVVSMLIEAMQYVIHAGRVTSTDDVLLNTFGAAAGVTLARPWWRRMRLVPRVTPRVPAQRRRVVCDAPVLLRVPRSTWDTRHALAASGPPGRASPWHGARY
jgi:hypothetical protein